MSEQVRNEIEKELKSLKKNLDKFSTATDIFEMANSLAAEAGDRIEEVSQRNETLLESSSAKLRELLKEKKDHIDLFKETTSKLTDLQNKIADSDIPSNLEKMESVLMTLNREINSNMNDLIHKQKDLYKRIDDWLKARESDNDKIVSTIESIPGEFKRYMELLSENSNSLNNDLKVMFDFVLESVSDIQLQSQRKQYDLAEKYRSDLRNTESNVMRSLNLSNKRISELEKIQNENFERHILEMYKVKDLNEYEHKLMFGGIVLIIVLQIIMFIV